MSRYTHPLALLRLRLLLHVGKGVTGKERPRWDGSRKTALLPTGAREGAPSLHGKFLILSLGLMRKNRTDARRTIEMYASHNV
jgi:hypothetical protein